ncbi:hypothetical protein QTH90_16450 [Variovorax sp. J2P1-59]|uniref:hypothetical protein n=1 Tax=Variovorax flavidus TaxID=3053501 RepID=UPI002578794C|nr:hypothetical protein [Variovorax sp. J2P1-59]MDM0075997.1 hypothetical protein [Variovorax sp. J2P1-59]
MNIRFADSVPQALSDEAAAIARQKKELLTRPQKLPAFSMELRAREGYAFKVGQRLTVALPAIDRYLAAPTTDVPLHAPDGEDVRAVPTATQLKVMLRAHFSGATVNVIILSVEPAPVHAGNREAVWKEAAATARVVFQ